MRIPLPERVVTVEASDGEHAAARKYPYRQLLGCIAYPSCHTKLEIRFAVSLLSRYMNKWSETHWNLCVRLLRYCINTREIGIVWGRGLDWHGVNVPYAYMQIVHSLRHVARGVGWQW